jgi:hypothetical protein
MLDHTAGMLKAVPVDVMTHVWPLFTATRAALPVPATSPARVTLDP